MHHIREFLMSVLLYREAGADKAWFLPPPSGIQSLLFVVSSPDCVMTPETTYISLKGKPKRDEDFHSRKINSGLLRTIVSH